MFSTVLCWSEYTFKEHRKHLYEMSCMPAAPDLQVCFLLWLAYRRHGKKCNQQFRAMWHLNYWPYIQRWSVLCHPHFVPSSNAWTYHYMKAWKNPSLLGHILIHQSMDFSTFNYFSSTLIGLVRSLKFECIQHRWAGGIDRCFQPLLSKHCFS